LRELLRTGDPVKLSRATTLLAEFEIATLVFDSHVSTIYGGAVEMLQQRLMVDDDDYRRAHWLLLTEGLVEPER
jgi:hypothetical protein